MQCSSGFSARGAAVPTTPLWLRHWACISPYYYFIETMSVSRTDSEIFSVKEWRRDLENGGRGRSRSLKMTPFDRSYTTFYWSAILSIAVCCTIFKLIDVE